MKNIWVHRPMAASSIVFQPDRFIMNGIENAFDRSFPHIFIRGFVEISGGSRVERAMPRLLPGRHPPFPIFRDWFWRLHWRVELASWRITIAAANPTGVCLVPRMSASARQRRVQTIAPLRWFWKRTAWLLINCSVSAAHAVRMISGSASPRSSAPVSTLNAWL